MFARAASLYSWPLDHPVFLNTLPRRWGGLLTPSRVCVQGKPLLTVASSPRACRATCVRVLQLGRPCSLANQPLPIRTCRPTPPTHPDGQPRRHAPADQPRRLAPCRLRVPLCLHHLQPRRRSCLRCDACCTVRSVLVASFRDDCEPLFSRHITEFRATLYRVVTVAA